MSGLFQNVLHVSFYGSIVIAAVLLLRLALKRAPKKYVCLLWVLAGLRLLMPFSIESTWSLQPEVPQMNRIQIEYEAPDSGMILALPDNVAMPEDAEAFHGDAFAELATGSAAVKETKKVIDYAAVGAWVWLAAACGLGLHSVLSYLRLKRRVREAVILSEGVWECTGIDTAFILGYLRPRIYVPAGLSDGSCRFILEHERSHLKRGDHWVKLVGFAALAIHWFNPLVWVAYILLCRDIEMACDEQVIRNMDLQERKFYSAALISCSTGHRSIAACPVAFGEVSVKQRIISVLNYRKKSFWFSLVGAAAIIFVAVCFLTNPKDQTSEPGEQEAGEWEAQCRAVLEEIQSRDYYYILEDRTLEGGVALNDSACGTNFGSGDKQMRITYIDDLDESQRYMAYTAIGGSHYQSVSSEPRFEWYEMNPGDVEDLTPWLYSFDMDAQETDAISRQETDGGYIIRLKVYAPSGSERIDTDSYHVDFYFDSEDGFRYAIRYVVGRTHQSIITTMYAPEATEGQILSTMSYYAGDLGRRELDISLGTANVEAEELLGIYLGPDTMQTDVPDWGVSLHAVNASPTGMTLYLERSGGSWPGGVVTEQYYWLERWNGSEWEAVEEIDTRYFTTEAFVIEPEGSHRWELNWRDQYGVLEAGTYRIGKSISNEVTHRTGVDLPPEAQEEVEHDFFAEFEIPAYAAEFEGNDLGKLLEGWNGEISWAYLMTIEGQVGLTREKEVVNVLEFLKNVYYDPEQSTQLTAEECGDYCRYYYTNISLNSYNGLCLFFDQDFGKVWAQNGDEFTDAYAVEDPEAVRAFFESNFDGVKDETVTAAPFAGGGEPWTWAQNISMDAVESTRLYTSVTTKISHNASSVRGSSGVISASRFEELLQILNSLTKDTFESKTRDGQDSLWDLCHDFGGDRGVTVTIADGANRETVILRCVGEEVELIFCGETSDIDGWDSQDMIYPDSLQCWVIRNETLLVWLRELMAYPNTINYWPELE